MPNNGTNSTVCPRTLLNISLATTTCSMKMTRLLGQLVSFTYYNVHIYSVASSVSGVWGSEVQGLRGPCLESMLISLEEDDFKICTYILLKSFEPVS